MEVFALPVLNMFVVQLLKPLLGFKGGAGVPPLALVAGVLLAAAQAALNGQPLDVSIVPGLVAGLGSMGVYDLAKKIVDSVVKAVEVPAVD